MDGKSGAEKLISQALQEPTLLQALGSSANPEKKEG
jgi:predicted component of type VI protein secretion system